MTKEDIIEILKTVYDPEIPILDIYNMGLIYDVDVKDKDVNIVMTLTTPTCPLADVILETIRNSIIQKYPEANVNLDLVFEPAWNPEMIKDEEVRQMFNA